MNRFDLLTAVECLLLLAVGLWLAKTPFEYFAAVVLAGLVPAIITVVVSNRYALSRFRNEIDKIYERMPMLRD